MKNALQVFNFKSKQLRTETIDGQTWFCLIDVCDGLGLLRKSKVLERLDLKGVRKTSLLTNGGNQELFFISEPNTYRLIFRSNKPAALQYASWVYEEVLPSIRKTGGYLSTQLSQKSMSAVGGLIKRCVAKAVREEIGQLNLIAAPSNDKGEESQLRLFYNVDDNQMLETLKRWYGTKNFSYIATIERLTKEKEDAEMRLRAIKKAIEK